MSFQSQSPNRVRPSIFQSSFAVSLVLIALHAQPARALSSLTASDLSGLTSTAVSSLIQTVAIGADHHAYMPATPMGVLLGLDLGFEVTAISVPTAFTSAMASATGESTSQIPSVLPIVKLNIHKGFPKGIDLGFSYIGLKDSSGATLVSSYGGDVKWAFLPGGVTPAAAVRFGVSSNTVYFMKTNTYSLDVLASKKLFVLDPYIGTGLQYWSGSISVPASVTALPTGVSSSASGVSPRVFGGLSFRLLIVRIVGEMDYSLAGISNYGVKGSLAF